jgi:hypothetical protein
VNKSSKREANRERGRVKRALRSSDQTQDQGREPSRSELEAGKLDEDIEEGRDKAKPRGRVYVLMHA